MNVCLVVKFLSGDKSISDKKGLTLLTAPSYYVKLVLVVG